jgi:amidase
MAALAADVPANVREREATAIRASSPADNSLAASRLRGLVIDHLEWVQVTYMRNGLRQRWQNLFQEVDVVVCPVMPTPAFPHDHSPHRTGQLDVDGKLIPYDDQIAWASIATLCGLPATAAPINHSETGLPIGVQIIGGFLEDRTTIAFAGLMEREYGGFVAPPSL